MMRSGALELPPNDGCVANDEQQQCSRSCAHGVSREHVAAPLGQYQAQDHHQENKHAYVAKVLEFQLYHQSFQ